MKKLYLGVIVVLLLLVNWLTFHDWAESYSLRDWLVLLASVLILAYIANPLLKQRTVN